MTIRLFIAMTLFLLPTPSKADAPTSTKKANPYMPKAQDLPADTGAAKGEDSQDAGMKTESKKWLSDDPALKKPRLDKIKKGATSPGKISVTATCVDAGKTYRPGDPDYNLCLENHRKNVERASDRERLIKGGEGKSEEVTPGVEVKFGDK